MSQVTLSEPGDTLEVNYLGITIVLEVVQSSGPMTLNVGGRDGLDRLLPR